MTRLDFGLFWCEGLDSGLFLLLPDQPEAEMLRLFPVYRSLHTHLLFRPAPAVFLVQRCPNLLHRHSAVGRDGYDYFRRAFYFHIQSGLYFRNSGGTSATPYLRTMVEVVSVRLTSPERVIMGVGTSSRAADTEIDSFSDCYDLHYRWERFL